MKLPVFAVIGGVIVTLVTGLISNTPPMRAGATLFGYPFPWLDRMVLPPQYNPWQVDILNLVADIIAWSIIIGIILFVVARSKKK